MNKDKFFIYGGFPKAGSTWLYQMLAKHPEVEMPIIKEVRYFYLKQEFGNITLWQKLFSKHWALNMRVWFLGKIKNYTKLLLKTKMGG